MASVWGELKRRNVFKVGAAYVVVAWLLIQVTDIVLPTFSSPEWVGQTITFVLILGLPVAVILAWAFEITPDGVKKTHRIPLEDSIAHITGQKLNYFVTGLLALAVVFLIVDDYFEDSVQRTVVQESVVETPTAVPEPEEAQLDVLPNSVAVLPFDNMSADPEDGYFAAGIHDEILNQLAKISALNVIARTSVMQYAGAARPITEIARELNVGTVMEGSVSYADGRVAVRAQLIDAVTGVHLWSESYNREFSDLFAIQADIARNIANALEAEFSLEEQGNIAHVPTSSPLAYALFLKAVSELQAGNVGIRNRMEPLLLNAIDLDPNFALAYAYLARVYAIIREETLTLEYAEKALELDPDSGLAYAAISFMNYRAGRFEEALEFSEQAVQRSPADSFVLDRYADDSLATGHVEQANRVLERAIELDPVNAELYSDLGWTRWHSGDRVGGIVAMRRAVELNPESSGPQRALGMMEATLGNIAEGVAQVQLAERLAATPSIHTAYSYRVVGLHEDAARVARASADEEFPAGILSVLYHLVLNEEEQALAALVQLTESSSFSAGPFIWVMTNALDDPTLEKPEFQALRAALREQVGWN